MSIGKDIERTTGCTVNIHMNDGYPAVIEKSLGNGKVITAATYVWYGENKGAGTGTPFAASLADRFCLRDITVDAPLRVRVSENEDTVFAFVFNYTETDVCTKVEGYGFAETVTVPANDVIILKREK